MNKYTDIDRLNEAKERRVIASVRQKYYTQLSASDKDWYMLACTYKTVIYEIIFFIEMLLGLYGNTMEVIDKFISFLYFVLTLEW